LAFFFVVILSLSLPFSVILSLLAFFL